MLEKYLRKKIRDYCDKTYPVKLTVVQSDEHRPLFNNRCQWNADALVRQGKAIAIVECVMVYEKQATLHYINLAADLTMFDATLGPAYTGGDYRLIHVLRDFPSDDPDDRLREMKHKIAQAAVGQMHWWYDSGCGLL